jgi:DNA-binding transcriptional LysR family regulator
MDLRQLTTFRTVAQTLSFHRAAAQLNYVQSSVSTQIQALEEELGVRLFDRLGKRTVLTEAGHQLLEYAEKILRMVEEAQTVVADSSEISGILTISAPETLWTYRLPPVLKEFRRRCPQVQLQFQHFSSKDMIYRVMDGSVDVALVLEEPMQATNVAVEPLIVEPLVVIASSDHSLAERERVVPLDLDGEQLLLTEIGCTYRNIFYRELARDGVYPTATLDFVSVEAIKACVKVGLGVAVLPSIVVQKEIEQGQLVILPWTVPHDFCVVTQIMWHKDKWLSPSLHAFLNVTRELLKSPAQDE